MSDFRARVITVSNRTAAGLWQDTSGPILVSGLADLGLDVDEPVVVPDGDAVGAALRTGLDLGFDLLITTGGTGLTPTDQTPEQTLPLLDRLIPGIAEAIRATGVAGGVASAVLSRGLAGQSGRTLIINVPGSSGGARDAVAALSPFLIHALEQVRGSDH